MTIPWETGNNKIYQEARNGMEKGKLSKIEKFWILYDVGNSAFILLASTMIPIYFNSLAETAGISESDYVAYWGYAASTATLCVAVIGPLLGTVADTRGYKKPLFTISMLLGVLGCMALSAQMSWFLFLAVFVVTKVGYSSSLIFYDAMLADITEPERMDQISSHGYAWGYIGSCIPFIVSLVFVLFYDSFGITPTGAMGIAFCLTGGWWLLLSLPLLKNYRQRHYTEPETRILKSSFGRLRQGLRDLKEHRRIFLFLAAFFFYIDGVYTIIDMATAYGSALGLDSQGLLLALLVTQIVAFPFALLFGKAAKRCPAGRLIKVCILAYTAIALYAIQLDRQWEFWVLAVCVGMFQGAIQALSRSYFAKIVPAEKSGEFFGIFDICGKGAAFLGTALVGVISQITGSPNAGVGVLAVMFLIGFVIFRRADRLNSLS